MAPSDITESAGEAVPTVTSAPSASSAPSAPPPGGYGAAPPSARFGPAPELTSEPRASSTALVTVGLVVVSLSTIVVLAIVGMRRYIARARTAEVRVALTEIGKHAVAVHEATRRVCPSASFPVPADEWALRGEYLAMRSEWRFDEAKNAGFACLDFEMHRPQYYQYRYDATDASFIARGRGVVDGDGAVSSFSFSGEVKSGRLVLAPKLTEDANEL
jgi:hypothetical protein